MKDLYDLEESLMSMWNMIDVLQVIATSEIEDKDTALFHYGKIMDAQMSATFQVYEEALADERARTIGVQEDRLSSVRTGLSDSLFKP
jgi:hypothetical protein